MLCINDRTTRRAGSKQSQISPLLGIDTVEKEKKKSKHGGEAVNREESPLCAVFLK
jgi:hypothetical protein